MAATDRISGAEARKAWADRVACALAMIDEEQLADYDWLFRLNPAAVFTLKIVRRGDNAQTFTCTAGVSKDGEENEE